MIFLFFPLAVIWSIPNQDNGNIIVTIDGISSSSGTLIIGLFDNPEDFTVTPVMSKMESVKNNGSITVEFRDVIYKKYAISVYHDLNNNQELDKNGLGIPTEPYGFSNNPKIFMGPSFEKSLFDFNQDELKLTILLR
ncbi:MAG TPA: DUF2141 domain-containing protein [Cyclobacteriaceae bacterium]|nr:DUF2141 domain-containing protein [Cyclobacteriaceae bacterium]